jgi:hypothetical protein
MSQNDEKREFWAEHLAEETARGERAAQDFPFKLVKTRRSLPHRQSHALHA